MYFAGTFSTRFSTKLLKTFTENSQVDLCQEEMWFENCYMAESFSGAILYLRLSLRPDVFKRPHAMIRSCFTAFLRQNETAHPQR